MIDYKKKCEQQLDEIIKLQKELILTMKGVK